ncbi:MAG: hypothetical protein ACTSWN_01530 [Promethearchaeota archaeon]
MLSEMRLGLSNLRDVKVPREIEKTTAFMVKSIPFFKGFFPLKSTSID